MRSKLTAIIMTMLIVASTLSVTINTPFATVDEAIPQTLNANPSNAQAINEISQSNQMAASNAGESLNTNDARSSTEPSVWNDTLSIESNHATFVIGVSQEKPNNYYDLRSVVTKYQGEVINTVSMNRKIIAAVVRVPLGTVSSFLEETKYKELSRYIEPNKKFQTQLVPNDPYWSMQWGPKKISADWAWNTTTGDRSVLVAVVDTGIDYNHEDLAANYVPLGYDWVNNDPDPMDDYGHGTHCAGIIAAALNNGIGIAGLAQVRIMAEKGLDAGGWGTEDWLANAIIDAVDQGADIMSMSWGGSSDSQLIHEAIRYAYDAGVLLVAAAGNSATNQKMYPAAYDEVIAVAATDPSDYPAWFTNYGDWIELAAPGVDIYSTVPWGYMYASGTSMACPHVSGVAALVWSRFPNTTRDWVRLWLRYTADDLGDPGFDINYGYGRINARKAVEQSPPKHELLAFSWKTPPYVEPGGTATINATILNFGGSNESDITVQLLANGSIVDSPSISLASGHSKVCSLLWNPAIEGAYNVTLYVVPVPNETVVENNVLWTNIFVGFPLKVVILHSAGNILTDAWQVLNFEWSRFGKTMVYIDYKTLDKENISYEDIAATDADVLIISCAYSPSYGWQFTDSEIKAIKRYVFEGHGLIATAGTFYNQVPNNNKLAPLFGLNETTQWSSTSTDLFHIKDTAHPLFRNIPNPFVMPQQGTALPSDGRWDANELAGGTYVALGHYRESAIVVYRGLVYISAWPEVIPDYYFFPMQLLYNAITWTRYQKPAHEIIASLEAPKFLQPGETALLNATVSNTGLSNETNVELSILIDDVVVKSAKISELQKDASVTINCSWIPATEKTYNLTAYAKPVPNEENTFNNVDTKIIFVHLVRFVLWDDTKDTDGDSLFGNYLSLYQLLTESGFVVNELAIGPITRDLLLDYDIFVLMDPELDFSPSEIADIQDWVATGGTLLVAPDGGYPSTINNLMRPYGVQMTGRAGGYGTTTDIVRHPITKGVNSIFVNWVQEISVTSPSMNLAWISDYGERYAFLSVDEDDKVVVASDSNIMDNTGLGTADNAQLMLNIFAWLSIKPQHDLRVSLDAPSFLEPGNSILLNATVSNRGLSNENDVQLQLLINNTIIQSVVIDELLKGSSYTLSLLWTPTVLGLYNVTAYAPPLLQEENIRNNVDSKSVRVGYPIARVAVLNAWEIPYYFTGGWSNDYQIFVDALNAQGFYAQAVKNEEIIGGILESFNVFVMVDNVPNDDAVPYVFDFWSSGGGIVAFDSSICFLNYAGILPPEAVPGNGNPIYWDYESGPAGRISKEHPVTKGYNIGQLIYGTSGDAVYKVDYLARTRVFPYYTMLVEDEKRLDRAYVSAYEPPTAGRVVHIWDQFHWRNDGLQLMILNAAEWVKLPLRDVAILSVLPSANKVMVGDAVDIAVVAENQGNATEDFTVTAYASSLNSTRIYLDPSEYLFDAATVYIGYRFNVTVKVHDVKDLFSYQADFRIDDSMLVITRAWLPKWDSTWVFSGKLTLSPAPALHDYDFDGYVDDVWVGDVLYGTEPTFTGDGLLGIIELEITAIPSLGETLSCNLVIDTYDTYLLDSYMDTIPSTNIDGYYALGWGAPPPPPPPPGIYRIGTTTVTDLAPGARITITFTWDTADVLPKDYRISANASVVPNEIDTTDNVYTDGIIKITKPPLADFIYSPTFPRAGETVTFNASSSTPDGGTIISYEWDFGDGNLTATTHAIITHTYAASGSYNVTLTITDSEGLTDSTWKTIYVCFRDVAVVAVKPSTNRTYAGRTINISVTVTNEGEGPESFTVTLYYNITAGKIIGTQNVSGLLPSEYRTLTFLWDTTGLKPNYYNITAVASSVFGETHIADNIMSSADPVRVKLFCDINGDGKVDIKDLAQAALAFGSYLGHPKWNPEADFNGDGKIDIRDLALIAKTFGRTI